MVTVIVAVVEVPEALAATLSRVSAVTVPKSKEAATVTTPALLMLNFPFLVPPVIEMIVGCCWP